MVSPTIYFDRVTMTVTTHRPTSSKKAREALFETILGIPSTAEFAAAAERFATYGEPTLIGPPARAFLHELVKVCNAKAVLEIGTYFAGTTRVLAEAVCGIGGVVITIDASGDRAPIVEEIVAAWPEEIRAATTFVPHLSSMFFEMFERTRSFKFELLFVDGDHSYRGALFDLLNCANYAQPNAVIVIDDYDLPPVFSATQDFLALNPQWRELSGSYDRDVASDPFAGMRSSVDGLPFLVLIGPPAASVGDRPINVSLGELADNDLQGVTVPLAGDHGEGRLHAKFVISSVTTQAMRSSSAATYATVSGGDAVVTIRLDPPLAPPFVDGATNNCDLSLVWESAAGDLLDLAGDPELITG